MLFFQAFFLKLKKNQLSYIKLDLLSVFLIFDFVLEKKY